MYTCVCMYVHAYVYRWCLGEGVKGSYELPLVRTRSRVLDLCKVRQYTHLLDHLPGPYMLLISM